MKTHSNKKGAIELSMTTIIVIVIGVTLLTLGLTWVKDIFNKGGALGDEAFLEADRMVREMMASDDDFFISGLSFEMKPGEIRTVGVGVRDYEGLGNVLLELTISGDDPNCELNWIKTPTEPLPTEEGDLTSIPFQINIPQGTPIGPTCFYTLNAESIAGDQYGTGTIIVNLVGD